MSPNTSSGCFPILLGGGMQQTGRTTTALDEIKNAAETARPYGRIFLRQASTQEP